MVAITVVLEDAAAQVFARLLDDPSLVDTARS